MEKRGQLTGSLRFVDEIEKKIERRVEFRGPGRPRKVEKKICLLFPCSKLPITVLNILGSILYQQWGSCGATGCRISLQSLIRR